MSVTHLRETLCRYDTAPVEVLVGLLAILWGVLVLLPHNVAFYEPQWAPLRHTHISRDLYGVLLIVYGVSRMWALKHHSLRARQRWSLVGILIWSYQTIVLLSYHVQGPGSAAMPICLLACIWIYLCLGRGCEHSSVANSLS